MYKAWDQQSGTFVAVKEISLAQIPREMLNGIQVRILEQSLSLLSDGIQCVVNFCLPSDQSAIGATFHQRSLFLTPSPS